MLISFEAALADGPVGAFTCYDLEEAEGVLAAAAAKERPVILLVSAEQFGRASAASFVAALSAFADRHSAAACLQLDHVREIDTIAAAFAHGVGAVMADGSHLSLSENIAYVNAAVEIAASYGGGVEAELGGIEGSEDVAEAVAAGRLTDPAEAERLVHETGASCLAVSIGNVHGHYLEPPSLHWGVLDGVRQRVGIPISLHGASGLPPDDVRRAVAAGVRKININTELREAYLAATEETLSGAGSGARLVELHDAQIAAVEAVARAQMELHE
jgi:tagatose 1,6-diphosphate aldolase GatY/KbaY